MNNSIQHIPSPNFNEVIKWLLEGDVSIQYQVYRNLLGIDRKDFQESISSEGWGEQFLSKRKPNGHLGVTKLHIALV
jgi:hypothetical protein